MKNLSSPISFLNRFRISLFLILVSGAFTMNAQVGIGTTDPDPSSILDIKSESAGLLVPRMTTAERTAIVSPANSLLVYDKDANAFFFYDTSSSSWIKLNSAINQRENYKLVKSAADLAPELTSGGGSTYKLQTNTLYEINGTITLTKSIDLNNAYVAGRDANEDILSYSGGAVFSGSTGGSIKNVTLKGARAFNIAGPGMASSSSLLVQNTIIDGMTTGVGSISGLGLYFGNIIQFINNANGITYSNIGNLLLSNQAWFSSNSGTFETYTGTFSLIQKASGFSTVSGSSIAMDVSTSGLSVGTGVLLSHVFSGITTAPSGYIKKYTTGSYAGYNFNNNWKVESPGIPSEGDAQATGNIYFSGTPSSTNLSPTATKLQVPTTATEMFRTSSTVNNRITYIGAKTRKFTIIGSFSIEDASNNSIPIISVAKNGNVLPSTKVTVKMPGGGGVQALSITGTTTLGPNDYIELYGEGVGGTSLKISGLNLLIY